MTRVDFYILPEDNEIEPIHYAARLIEKVFRLNRTVYVHTASHEQTQKLSEMLWQRDNSFLAHSINDEEPQGLIHISHTEQLGQHDDVLISLAGTVPTFFSRFQRVAEIVPGLPQARTQSRKNFMFYKERGYALNTFTI